MEPTDTPQKYGATEDDELSCFLSVEDKKEDSKSVFTGEELVHEQNAVDLHE